MRPAATARTRKPRCGNNTWSTCSGSQSDNPYIPERLLAVSRIRIEPDGEIMRLLRALLPGVAVAAGLWGQTADKPLTNSEIESMLAAGLPESTILMKIQAAAFRGLVDLDASSNALINLKQKGASEQVLDALVWAEPFGAAL